MVEYTTVWWLARMALPPALLEPMPWSRIWTGFLVLAALCHPVSAFVLDENGQGHPLHWKDDAPVSYFLVEDNVPGGPEGEDAVHRAFQTWSHASTGTEYRFGGYVPVGARRNDGKNVVYWVDRGWPYDPALAALTHRDYDTRDGHLLDVDIVFNAEGYEWSVDGLALDIQSAVTHEVGHFTGLGHSSDRDATMYARTALGETSKRSLARDDLAALDALFWRNVTSSRDERRSLAGKRKWPSVGLGVPHGPQGADRADQLASGNARTLAEEHRPVR